MVDCLVGVGYKVLLDGRYGILEMRQCANLVVYQRVSTGRQGLGLDAQAAAVAAYLSSLSPAPKVVGRFVEVESGKRNDRPELAKAIELTRLTGATLVIAKLDRLSRDAHFLLGLEKAGVEFVCCDMPHANRLTIGILAIVAEEERRLISERTRAALAAAKARGARLGSPTNGAHLKGLGNAQAVAAIQAGADAYAKRLGPVLAELAALGIVTANAQAKALNERSIRTPRGGKWAAQSVLNVRARLAAVR